MQTLTEYRTLDEAHSHFNARLFGGELPECLIVLQRKSKRNLGYFRPESFEHRSEETSIDEIALNPDNFIGRTDQEILSTLVHEMVHVWQHHFGKPSRNGYHNKEWGEKMDEIGLCPSNTGELGGKRTGQQMTHYIIEGGPFDVACAEFTGKLQWQSLPRPSALKTKASSKTKFTCPECGQNAWAKPTSNLMCGDCEIHMEEA